jgi:hypothetical protein
MRQYRVEFSEAAEAELFASIVWGIEKWGTEETFQWARDVRASIKNAELIYAKPAVSSGIVRSGNRNQTDDLWPLSDFV